MENRILGLHHITAIAGNAQSNFNFYTKVLGLRMVKKTVNFDDPGTYHFYFGDEAGTPGSILTFFPWEGIGQGRTGAGMATEIGYSVPLGSLGFWAGRFKQFNVKHGPVAETFGEQYLPFTDPDGLKINLVVSSTTDTRKPWATADVPAEVATRGFHNIVLTLNEVKGTAEVLTGIFGYRLLGKEGDRHRFITDAIGQANIVDIIELPTEKPGINAAGTNHHIAFRVSDEEILMNFREKILEEGFSITPKIDRDYFFSLYFREPGGVLFELATDNPGFARDEAPDALGTALKLPKQYEAHRLQIEASLPKLN